MTTENAVPQITREELEAMPLSPELHNVRQELLFKTEAAWAQWEATTESLAAEWTAFFDQVHKFQDENGSIQ